MHPKAATLGASICSLHGTHHPMARSATAGSSWRAKRQCSLRKPAGMEVSRFKQLCVECPARLQTRRATPRPSETKLEALPEDHHLMTARNASHIEDIQPRR